MQFTGARTDARNVIARADVVVLSSDWDGLSITALEALSAGTPVVSTPVPGTSALAGVVVTRDFTSEALAAEISALLHDPERRAALGAAGERHVHEHLSETAMVDAYERRYAALAPTILR